MITFKNKGEIDIRAVTTFGISSKENENAIGYFGTGLKYAIAILLRTGHKITIHSGLETWEFSTTKETIRVDEFETITLNGNRLAFTTELGKTWEVWQAYRELHCNCTDEYGEIYSGNATKEDGFTIICVDGPEIEESFRSRDQIVISNLPAIYQDSAGVILGGRSSHVFYRGIRAYQLAKPTIQTYNLTDQLDLTEDRTIKSEYDIRHLMARLIGRCNDPIIIKAAVLAGDENFEKTLDYSYSAATETFKEIVRECAKINPLKVNPSALQISKIDRRKLLPTESTTELDPIDAERLRKAINFCQSIGFNVDSRPIILVERIDDGVMGLAHEGNIYVTRLAFNQGTKQLAATLIEELLHLDHGLQDNTRAMQNFLFESLVSIGERLVGEVL